MADTCSSPSCGAPITWCKTSTTKSAIPVDREPSLQGNLLVLPESLTAVHLTRREADWVRSKGVETHTSHFVTCPDSAKYRRRRESGYGKRAGR